MLALAKRSGMEAEYTLGGDLAIAHMCGTT